jgi:hypothetical protein
MALIACRAEEAPLTLEPPPVERPGGTATSVARSPEPELAAPVDDEEEDPHPHIGKGWIQFERAGIETATPRGWAKTQRSRWTIFTSPDEDGRQLGFLEFDGKEAGVIAQIPAAFGVHDVDYVDHPPPRDVDLGEGRLPARLVDATCKLRNGRTCELAYAIIRRPARSALLMVYVVPPSQGTCGGRVLPALKKMRALD